MGRLNSALIAKAKALCDRGMSMAAAARALGVVPRRLCEALSGDSWAHLQVEPAKTVADRMFRRLSPTRDEWIADALKAVQSIAERFDTFTTDHVREAVAEPPEPRLLGAVMKLAEAEGFCSQTEDTIKSERPECHGRRVRVWRSEIR